MNKINKNIHNNETRSTISVSELATARGKKSKATLTATVALTALVGHLAFNVAQAQVKIGDNPITINPGSVLEIESTNKGLLFTRIAVTDRNTWGLNGNLPVEGMVVYNSTATTGVNGLQEGLAVWKNGQWISVDETPYLHVNSSTVGNSTIANSGAQGADSIAIGPNALATGQSSIAQGYGATSSAMNAVAIGTNANASAANSVALGANSIADGSTLSMPAYNPGGVIAGTTPVGEISVGAAGAERRITNVAAGGADTDAVNVSQLRAVGTTTLTQANQYTDNSVTQAAATTLNQANQYTDNAVTQASANAVNQANNYTDKIARRAYGGVAAAMAMGEAPYAAGKWTAYEGIGYYHGQFAVGASLRRTSHNGRWSIIGSATYSPHGGAGARIGATQILGSN